MYLPLVKYFIVLTGGRAKKCKVLPLVSLSHIWVAWGNLVSTTEEWQTVAVLTGWQLDLPSGLARVRVGEEMFILLALVYSATEAETAGKAMGHHIWQDMLGRIFTNRTHTQSQSSASTENYLASSFMSQDVGGSCWNDQDMKTNMSTCTVQWQPLMTVCNFARFIITWEYADLELDMKHEQCNTVIRSF